MCRFVSLIGSIVSASSHGEAEKPGDIVIHHLTDRPADYSFVNWLNSHIFNHKFFGFLDLHVTWWVLMIWIAFFVCLLIFIPLARSVVKSINGSSSRWVNMWEAIIEYINQEVLEPNFGKKSKKIAPYFLTVFFFILFSNLLGLIPGFNSPTGNLSITAALALLSLILMFSVGFFKHGPLWLITGIVPHGIPWPIIPLMWAIELVGLFMKPIVLMIRLFANMLAGHIVIIVFILLIIMFQNLFIAFGSIPAAIFVYALEILVSFVQAYVFTMLTAIFIAGCMESH
jgi:F-type H+-transporting ATPase subunit a